MTTRPYCHAYGRPFSLTVLTPLTRAFFTYAQVAYGLSVKGFDINATIQPVTIDVDRRTEPNVRNHEKAVAMHASVTASMLTPGAKYVLYRYTGINSFPRTSGDFASCEHKVAFVAEGEVWRYDDTLPFMSSNATYYIVAPANEE